MRVVNGCEARGEDDGDGRRQEVEGAAHDSRQPRTQRRLEERVNARYEDHSLDHPHQIASLELQEEGKQAV